MERLIFIELYFRRIKCSDQIYLTNLIIGCYRLHKTKSSGSIPHIMVNLIHLFVEILFLENIDLQKIWKK